MSESGATDDAVETGSATGDDGNAAGIDDESDGFEDAAEPIGASGEPDRFEVAGIMIGCGLFGVFLVALVGGLIDASVTRTAFTAVVLAGGILGGVVVAYYGVVGYETVWAFDLGAWLAAMAFVAFANQVRVGILVFANTYLSTGEYRLVVLAAAILVGALTTRVVKRIG
jgi:hypothetical protein